jgi:hypothetical protein
MVDPADWQTGPLVGDNGHAPRSDLAMFSGPTTDYGLGYDHGGFIDSAFMDNIQQLTDCDLANGLGLHLPLQQSPKEIEAVTITLQLPYLAGRSIFPPQLFSFQ